MMVYKKIDRCRVLSEVAPTGRDSRSDSWTQGSEIACRFLRKGRASEHSTTGAEPILTDAAIVLPQGTSVTNKQALRLTNRKGSALSPPEDYEIIGEPWTQGSGDIMCYVRRSPRSLTVA